MGIRFHVKSPEEMAENNDFIRAVIDNSKEF